MSKTREALTLLQEDNHILFGPRQSGKSTLIKKQVRVDYFFSMESSADRSRFANDDLFLIKHIEDDIQKPIRKHKAKLKVGIDEIHKLYDWRRKIKFLIDEYKENIQFFISGSSAFDLIKNDGDSLIGRLFYTKILPFTFSEFLENAPVSLKNDVHLIYEDLLKTKFTKDTSPLHLSCFPEPCLKKNNAWAKRWAANYIESLIDKDLAEISKVPDKNAVHNLYKLLLESSGSTVSIDSFRKTLNKSHDSVTSMLSALEKVWAIWKLQSFQSSAAKTIRKEVKYYASDIIFNPTFETKVALALLKRVTALRQSSGDKYQLYFYRDYENKEVDFVITLNDKPFLAIESKEKENQIPSSLKYFCQKFKCPGIVLTNEHKQLEFINNFIICGFDRFARNFL